MVVGGRIFLKKHLARKDGVMDEVKRTSVFGDGARQVGLGNVTCI